MSDFAKEIASSSISCYRRIKFFHPILELDERTVFFIFNVIEPVDHIAHVFPLIDISFL